METKSFISSIVDKKKAMKWLREKMGWNPETISKQLSSLPIPLDLIVMDVRWYLVHSREWGFKELKSVYQEGLFIPHAGCNGRSLPAVEECGFEVTVETIISPEEHDLFLKKIEELKEIEDAYEWFSKQTDDIKKKIELLRYAWVVR